MAFMDYLLGDKQKTQGFQDFMKNQSNFWLGQPEETRQFEKFTPQQQQTLNSLLGMANQQLPSGLDFLSSILSQSPEMMEKFEAPARRAFSEKTIPSIAERFTGTFGSGSQQSSAFGQQLGQAAAGLEESLAAQRANLGMGALSQLQSLLSTGLTPQFETAYFPQTKGFLQTGAEGILKLLPLLLAG